MNKSRLTLFANLTVLLLFPFCLDVSLAQSRMSIHQTTLEEPNQMTPEVSTEELIKILETKAEPVLDVRSAKEFSIAHIPGSVNIYEKELDRVVQLFPIKSTGLVFYCNGPYCGKSKRLSEQLVKLGYTNIRRYQLGLPVWRALGHTVQTDLEGFRYVIENDKTAVFVDARPRSAMSTKLIPGSVNIQRGEADKANEDGRLPYQDKGTRVIVFAHSVTDARAVAEEIARKAYWNTSYFGGSLEELKRWRQ